MMPATPEQEAILRSIGMALKETRDGLRSESALSQRATAKAVEAAVQNQLSHALSQAQGVAEQEARRVVAGSLRPEVSVHNDVTTPTPQVTVHVDMTPVAQALKSVARALTGMADMIGQLVESMPHEPPSVVVEQPQRKGRRLRVKHDDGSETLITEE